ncbi:hypothetical protein CVT25_000503 [Psilocybe cyanescens]|uniref:CxC5 like cysteine cluster associated with KDZ domain-containing protein n=1 Tax=Psilocybe cyanescens TaxID=93625 RepID=A0A409XM20_PSICY|nr:hypothetical protein CVT25_000503 [Psilocybe cyanescens]
MECVGDRKDLLQHNERHKSSDISGLIAVKLDEMAELLMLVPTYSKSTRKLKQKLVMISHQEIAAVHVIYSVSIECEELDCQSRALQQDIHIHDISQVTLIKGTTIYKNVSVLTGRCNLCDSIYYADHKSVNQGSIQKQSVYLNSAKYMKIGQSTWIDWSFGIFMLLLLHIQSFEIINLVKSTWIALQFNPIVTFGRHLFRSKISIPTDHACLECTQPFRADANSDTIDVKYAYVTMHVVDGIVMEPTHSAYPVCQNELLNACGGVFCAVHEMEYDRNSNSTKVAFTHACEEHQREWQKHVQNHSSGALAGVRRMLRQPGENLEWLAASIQNTPQPHDGPAPPERELKNYFNFNCFYCVETVCAPCGTVIAWAKFAQSESPTNIMAFLN